MGANGFTIERNFQRIRGSDEKASTSLPLTLNEVKLFKRQFSYPAEIGISTLASQMSTLKSQKHKTNPNIMVFGVDDIYFKISGYDFEKGRNFSDIELQNGHNSVVIGKTLSNKLFPKIKNPVGRAVFIGSIKYQVIGILAEKGSSGGFGNDERAFIPYITEKNNFNRAERSYKISVSLTDDPNIDAAINEATGMFRVIRRLRPRDTDDFIIVKSDLLSGTLGELIGYLTIGAFVIGIITLFGSALGLLNIMLVLVTERTREIGICKSIGATASNIRVQFLTEAIVICLIGGIVGIILGITIGNVVALFLSAPFTIPWLWILVGLIFCFIIGILAGIYPANRAAKLNPIESLRHE